MGVYSLAVDLLESASRTGDQAALLSDLAEKDALVILNHPDWQRIPHYRREVLDELSPYDAIEICNAVIDRLPGDGVATGKWDYLLGQGRHVLGFASDDSHLEDDIGHAWIMVRSPERSAEAIFRSICEGNFYCSSGVVFSDIQRDGPVIHVESENAEEIQIIGTDGRLVRKEAKPSVSFNVGDREGYVRFTAFGPGSSMAWTQPFVLSG
jgi:hypothetical protein